MEEHTYLVHHGIKGQKWGIRRYQNSDGTLTSEGKKRYYNSDGSFTTDKKLRKEFKKFIYKDYKKSMKEAYKQGYRIYKTEKKQAKDEYKFSKQGATQKQQEKLKALMDKKVSQANMNYNASILKSKQEYSNKYGKSGVAYLESKRIKNQKIGSAMAVLLPIPVVHLLPAINNGKRALALSEVERKNRSRKKFSDFKTKTLSVINRKGA